jgi:tetratricopeptide (TPR) repeat protein
MRLLLLMSLLAATADTPARSPEPAASPEAVSLLGRPLVSPALPEQRRHTLEANLEQARKEQAAKPGDADALIWLGRRTAYLGRFREAIAIYTRGIETHPKDARFYRHRGHRYITVRELDKAVADLTRASELIRGRPDAVEPDGEPNALGIPTSTNHFNIWYHLALARYLQGDLEKALLAYRKCLNVSRDNPDRLVATSDWLYMTLRRLGRKEEAARVLEPITPELKVIENHAYWHRLLMYKGFEKPEELLGPREDGVELATYGYGVGNWYLYNGDRERAKAVFEKVIQGPQWAAFGFIAAEAELARMK